MLPLEHFGRFRLLSLRQLGGIATPPETAWPVAESARNRCGIARATCAADLQWRFGYSPPFSFFAEREWRTDVYWNAVLSPCLHTPSHALLPSPHLSGRYHAEQAPPAVLRRQVPPAIHALFCSSALASCLHASSTRTSVVDTFHSFLRRARRNILRLGCCPYVQCSILIANVPRVDT
jgi:hypothetical protein